MSPIKFRRKRPRQSRFFCGNCGSFQIKSLGINVWASRGDSNCWWRRDDAFYSIRRLRLKGANVTIGIWNRCSRFSTRSTPGACCTIVSLRNGMVIGDSSSRRQATELLTVLTAPPRHDANLPGNLRSPSPSDETSVEDGTGRRGGGREGGGRGKRKRTRNRQGKKWRTARVFTRDV